MIAKDSGELFGLVLHPRIFAGVKLGCATPWHPLLAQLSWPVRTPASEAWWSLIASQTDPCVEWHCMQLSLGKGFRSRMVFLASSSGTLRYSVA